MSIKRYPLQLPVLFGMACQACLCLFACHSDPQEPDYYLTVENGTGSGWYNSGDLVPVSATTPGTQRFLAWEGDTTYLQEPGAPNTYFEMPDEDGAIQAYHLPSGIVSFKYEVFPILKQYCALEGCHKNSIKQANFDDYSSIVVVSSKIESFVMSDIMPLNGPLPAALKQPLLDWISQGSQHN